MQGKRRNECFGNGGYRRYKYRSKKMKLCSSVFFATENRIEIANLERKCSKYMDSCVCSEKNIKRLDTRKKLLYNN